MSLFYVVVGYWVPGYAENDLWAPVEPNQTPGWSTVAPNQSPGYSQVSPIQTPGWTEIVP